MAKVPFPGIIGPTYTLNSRNAECQRCMNMLVEKVESGSGKATTYLKTRPGLTTFMDVENITFTSADLSADPGLAAFADHTDVPIQAMKKCANGRVFVVILSRLFELFSHGTLVYKGTLIVTTTLTDTNTYQMAENSLALYIIAGYKDAFLSDLSTYGMGSLTFSTDGFHTISYARAGFLGSKFIDFMDQYLLVTCINTTDPNRITSQFQISPLAVGAETVWAAGDVFTIESNPDLINGFIVNGREAWFFGPESYEVWYNDGDATRPFKRIPGAAYAIGLHAPKSLLVFQTAVFWLGSSKDGAGIVWMSEGNQAVRISNTAIEQMIKAIDITDSAYAWAYQEAGHSVYVLSFPSAKVTYAYDLMTGYWHELSYRDSDTEAITQHRGKFQIFAFGKNLVSDFKNGVIYELSSDIYTDNGAAIVKYRRTTAVFKGTSPLVYNELNIEAQMGVGLSDGSDPKVSVRWSNDNGYNWSNYHSRTLGKQGQYSQSLSFNQLGYSKKPRVFEILCSDPVPFTIISAELDVEEAD